MRGYFIFCFSVIGLVCFAFLLLSAANLFLFWLFLEMCTLCLVPLFFLSTGVVGLSGLFSYLVVSSVSSSLFVGAIMFEEFLFLAVASLLVKFGVFPFMGWVYKVVNNSNWCVVWGLSTMLKVPFFLFPFFLVGFGQELVGLLVSITFFVLFVLFWVYTFSWFSCWCHMMLSSSASLIAMSLYQSLGSLMVFFCVYVFWCTVVVVFLSFQGGLSLVGQLPPFLFSLLLVSFPFSLAIFYKFLLAGCMFSCGVGVFFMWVLYTASEQFFLLKFLIDVSVPRSSSSVLVFV